MSLSLALFLLSQPTADPAVVRSEYIFDAKPTPECHASTIAETPTGLVAAWFAGTQEKHKDVGIWVSRYDGGAWTTPVEAFNGVQTDGSRHPCWNPVLFQQPGGPLALLYKVGPSPSEWWGMRALSKDGGKTWSPGERLAGTALGPIKNKPVLLADGTLLCGSSTEIRGDGWRLWMERTRDLGKTWERRGPLNDKAVGAIQPTILNWGPGRLQTLNRPQRAGTVLECWSADDGKTWSPPTPAALPNPGSGIDAAMLRDGRGLLVYNHTAKGRSPLNIAVSSDGKAWQAALVLENTPGREFSYPAVIQTADGLVHTTYTFQRERVRHVVIDPAKLTPRPFAADGKWPG
ncbi:MAG: sialidase family protein [Gemmataceae bacterium]